METNRKHGVKEPPPQVATHGGPRGAIEDLAHRFWSGRPLSQATVEATRTPVRLDRDFIPGSMLPPPPVKARCGDLEVDRVERRAALAGSDLRLTRREFSVLLCLMDRINRVVP